MCFDSGCSFVLPFSDEDQEFVAFSSDEELVIALGSSREDGSFKVYIEGSLSSFIIPA